MTSTPWRAIVGLAGLLSTSVATAAALPAAPAAAAEAAIYRVEPGSRILAVTRRAGLLGVLGHDHAIQGERLSGRVTYAPGAAAGEALTGEVVVDAAALEIDAPAARQAAGLGGGPSGKDLGEIRQTFHGAEGLDTTEFPTIRLVLSGAETAQPGGAGPTADLTAITRVAGELTLHGRTRPITIPVTVSRSGARLLVRGRTDIRQSEFGIRPASVAGGLVKVKDQVELSFTLELEEASPRQ